jgi:hypothetical protein
MVVFYKKGRTDRVESVDMSFFHNFLDKSN